MAIGRERVVSMTAVSIVRIVASASVFAGSAVLVSYVQHEQKLAAGAVTATTSVPQRAPGVRSEAAPLTNETSPAHAATQGQAALVAAGANPTAVAAELARLPDAAGNDQSSPSFDITRVEANGDAVIAGRAAPGATVDLLRGGERLDRAVAGPSGEFVMIPPRLPTGSYELTLSAKLLDGTVTFSKHGAAVMVNDVAPSDRAAQSHAEYVPEASFQPRPTSEPRVETGKPQESTRLQPAPAIHANSASDEGASSPGGVHASKVVSRGDSLWRISHITYGDGSQYAFLYRANRERIRNPNLIYPGQTLVLPPRRN